MARGHKGCLSWSVASSSGEISAGWYSMTFAGSVMSIRGNCILLHFGQWCCMSAHHGLYVAVLVYVSEQDEHWYSTSLGIDWISGGCALPA